MRTLSVQAADQAFATLLAEVEGGAIVQITRDGRAVAELRPPAAGVHDDPAWRERYDRMVEQMALWQEVGYRVGTITADDKYGDAPV